MMRLGTQKKKRKRKKTHSIWKRSYDGLLGERPAVEDGSSQFLLETDRD